MSLGYPRAEKTRYSEISLDEIDLLDIGNSIVMSGTIFAGNGRTYLVPLPGRVEDLAQQTVVLVMGDADWERFLHQSDVLDVQSSVPGKAILRKSQRAIDRNIQWEVFKRDGYRCRYCGIEAPLTVDHVVLWENGGPTIEENLISACGPCNRKRGRMEYDEWINSRAYERVSAGTDTSAHVPHLLNLSVTHRLEELRAIKTKERSR